MHGLLFCQTKADRIHLCRGAHVERASLYIAHSKIHVTDKEHLRVFGNLLGYKGRLVLSLGRRLSGWPCLGNGYNDATHNEDCRQDSGCHHHRLPADHGACGSLGLGSGNFLLESGIAVARTRRLMRGIGTRLGIGCLPGHAIKLGQELGNGLGAVAPATLHGMGDGCDDLRGDSARLQRLEGKTVLIDRRSAGRCLSGEQFVVCSSEGIDIGLGRELAHSALHILLQRSVALTDTHWGAAGLVARGRVVLLGETEVDEHNLVFIGEHDVGWLDVEMGHALGMNIGQGVGHLTDIARGLGLREGSLSPNPIGQRTTGDILHHIVGCAVFLEHINDAHDVWVVEPGYAAGFLEKLLAIAVYRLAVALGAKGHATTVTGATTGFAHEELLDSHRTFQPALNGEVSNAEATLTQHLLYAVFATLKIVARVQRECHIHIGKLFIALQM